MTHYIQPIQEIVVLEHIVLASNTTSAGLPTYSNSTFGHGTLANMTAPSNNTDSTAPSYNGTFSNMTYSGTTSIRATGAAVYNFSASHNGRGFFF